MAYVNDPDTIKRLLSTGGRWAVVGLSTNTARPAYSVAQFLQRRLDMDILPVNLKGEGVHGVEGHRRLDEIDGQIDVVDCFVNSRRVGPVVDQAIEAGAKAVWLQLGVIDEDAAERASAAGLDVVMNACPAIEAPKLGL